MNNENKGLTAQQLVDRITDQNTDVEDVLTMKDYTAYPAFDIDADSNSLLLTAVRAPECEGLHLDKNITHLAVRTSLESGEGLNLIVRSISADIFGTVYLNTKHLNAPAFVTFQLGNMGFDAFPHNIVRCMNHLEGLLGAQTLRFVRRES